MEKEEWRDILGYEGIYQVSNLGRVKRIRKSRRTRRILAPTIDSRGYLRVSLHSGGVGSPHTIHELVATAFHGNRPPKHVVHHIDKIRTNNHAGNLMWVTTSDHINKFHKRKGNNHQGRIYPTEIAEAIIKKHPQLVEEWQNFSEEEEYSRYRFTWWLRDEKPELYAEVKAELEKL